MNVKICPQCGQVFSTTAAGLELMYAHLIQEQQAFTSREKTGISPCFRIGLTAMETGTRRKMD